MATIRSSKPLAPTVKIANPDGTPTRDFHLWLTQQYAHLLAPGKPSDFTPIEATLTAAGALNRLVATMATKNAVEPMTFTIAQNPGALHLAFTGKELRTTANPAGAVGTHYVQITAVDDEGTGFSGTIKITLT